MRAYTLSEILLRFLDPYLGLRNPRLWSRSLQGLSEFATQTINLPPREADIRFVAQRLCRLLHSVS